MFLADVAALAARLPDHRYILNLCTDRYRFMVGFAAALCRQQISLLPPGDTAGILSAIAEDYPDLYALTDATRVSLPGLIYPETLDDARAPRAVPLVRRQQPALILFTSGSTGRPTPVAKSWGSIVRSARAAGDRLGVQRLTAPTVIGTVPHQHSYGLESTILLSLQHGLILDAGGLFYPADIRARLLAVNGPCILVTTPVHLQALVADPDGMPQVDLILSATAPLSTSLATTAEACFRAPLIEIYGCTEAGQMATRRTVQGEEWHCLDGVVLTARDGGTWASGASVEGVVLLQDVVEQTGDGRFLLRGRSADLVDVAGKRTSMAYLNHHLLEIAGVVDGAFVMQEPDKGRVARLAALVVAPGLGAEAIQRTLRERIDPAFLPRPLLLVESLPRNALGKLPREALLALLRRDRDGEPMQSAELYFAHDHPTAAGHFPGNPIIPGALLLDAVVDAITAQAGSADGIHIRSAKFHRPVRPGESIRLQWRPQANGAITFECRVVDEDGLAATGTIEIGGTAR
jgi:acyl-CoA synthetase (AMP-forming)/AMP-acid ligase II